MTKKLQYEYSVKGLEEWLKTQDPEKEYTYTNSARCLIATFARKTRTKYEQPDTLSSNWKYGTTEQKLEWIAVLYPRTYGAALKRARRYLAYEKRKRVAA